MTTFNIGSQQAGTINQAGGNQIIHHASGTLVAAPLQAIADLRAAIETVALPAAAGHEAAQALDAVEAELEAPAPDKAAVAGGLERLTEVLGKAGALAQAGESLAGPLRSLASWAGAAGALALRALV